jgi:hypothetical protein
MFIRVDASYDSDHSPRAIGRRRSIYNALGRLSSLEHWSASSKVVLPVSEHGSVKFAVATRVDPADLDANAHLEHADEKVNSLRNPASDVKVASTLSPSSDLGAPRWRFHINLVFRGVNQYCAIPLQFSPLVQSSTPCEEIASGHGLRGELA